MLVLNRAAQRSKKKRLERFTFNLIGSGNVREEKLEGRDHLVVPCVMIKEGVLNGDQGPGLYLERYTAPTAFSWDHMPVVVYHPKNKGARSPNVINMKKIGIVLNTRWDSKAKKLRSEVWLDHDRTMKIDRRIIEAIKKGKKVEVSTGLLLNRRPQDGVWKDGKSYDWIATGQKPDHLAVLPDQKGACSIKDGAGILANAKLKKDAIKMIRRVVNEAFVSRIVTDSDLKKAIKGFKHAKNKSEVKEHIIRRARVLGLVSLLPEEWNVTVNKGSNMLSRKKKLRMVTRLVTNSQVWGPKDKSALMKMPDDQFKKVYRQALAAERDDDDEEETVIEKEVRNEAKKAGIKVPKKKSKKGSSGPISEDAWLKNAPESVRAVFNQGKIALTRRKRYLIGVIINNEQNVFDKKWLRNQDINLLEGLAKLALNKKSDEDEDEEEIGDGMFQSGFQPDYTGAVGAANARRRGRHDEEEEDGLPMPRLFPAGGTKKRRKKSAA